MPRSPKIGLAALKPTREKISGLISTSTIKSEDDDTLSDSTTLEEIVMMGSQCEQKKANDDDDVKEGQPRDKITWDFITCGYLIFMSVTFCPAVLSIGLCLIPFIPVDNVIEGFRFSDSGFCLALSGFTSLFPDMFITPWLKTNRSRRIAHVMFLVLNQLADVCFLVGFWTQNKIWVYMWAFLSGCSFDMTFTVLNAFGDADIISLGALHKRMSIYGRWYKFGGALLYCIPFLYLQLGFVSVALISTGFGTIRLILQVVLYGRSPAENDVNKIADKNFMMKHISSYGLSIANIAFTVSSRTILESKDNSAMLSHLSVYSPFASSYAFCLSPRALPDEKAQKPSKQRWPLLYYFLLLVQFLIMSVNNMLSCGGGVYLNLKFGLSLDTCTNAVSVGYVIYVVYSFCEMRYSPDSVLKVFPTSIIIHFLPVSVMLMVCFFPASTAPASTIFWGCIVACFFVLLAILEVQMLAVRQTVVNLENQYHFNIAMNLQNVLKGIAFGFAVFPFFDESYILFEWVNVGVSVTIAVVVLTLHWVWRFHHRI